MPETVEPPGGGGALGAGGPDEIQKEFATVKARFKTDVAALSKLTREFGGLKDSLKDINVELTKMIALGADTKVALQGIAQAGGGVGLPGPATGDGRSSPAGGTQGVKVDAGSGMWKKFTDQLRTAETDRLSPKTAGQTALNLGLQAAEQAMKWGQTRIKAHAPYALSSDRMGMLIRQMEGGRMTQLQYQANFREPLTDYMIGSAGITPLLGLEVSTGLDATKMAKGVEGIRVASGFGYSTQDATSMIRAMAQPGSSNLMTMMLGMGLYGPGGTARDPMDVIRNTVQRMGLTNPAMLEGALQPGSMTRANLARTGLPMDMQDLVIQYAQENVSFQELGGKGMYDPSNKAHRQRMGVEEGYATEFERTRQEEMGREENFYRRQIDNYAQLEKNTQRLIEVFGQLEDTLSPLIGAQVSMTNKWWRGALPLAGAVAGGAVGLLGMNPGTVFLGATAGYAAGKAASSALGDPAPGPTGALAPRPIRALAPGPMAALGRAVGDPEPIAATDFSKFKLKPNLVGSGAKGTTGIQAMANLAALPAAEGGISTKLTLTSGTRTEEEQWALFADKKSGGGDDGRHTVVGEGHWSQDQPQQGDRLYNNKYYRLNDNGRARGFAAVPGKSDHQTGAAADLGPREAHRWIARWAPQFGMRTADDEDWHVTLSSGATPPATETLRSGGPVDGSSTANVPPDSAVTGQVSISTDAQKTYEPSTVQELSKSMEDVRMSQRTNVERLDLGKLQRRHEKYSPVTYTDPLFPDSQPVSIPELGPLWTPVGDPTPSPRWRSKVGDPVPPTTSPGPWNDAAAGGSSPVITISPTLNLSGSGNSAADAQNLADQVIRLIETSRVVQTLRRS